MIDVLISYQEAYMRGLAGTLKLAGAAWLVGMTGGILLGYIGHTRNMLGRVVNFLHYVLISIPVLVLLFWLHYPAQSALGVVVNPFFTSALVLAFVNILLVANTVMNGLSQVPAGYLDAAIISGIPRSAAVWRVHVPLVFRRILPAVIGHQIAVLQMTLFAALISYEELFRISQQINAQAYQPIEIYTLLALFFLLLCYPPLLVSRRLRARWKF